MGFFGEKLLARARDFIRFSLPTDAEQFQRPVVIVYHGDGDGCCSAYFLKKHIQSPALLYWVATPDFDFARAEDHISQQKPCLCIFLDLPVCSRPEMVERLSSGRNVLIYDHHHPGVGDRCDSTDTVLYINPVVHQNGREFPTALFGWELLTDRTGFDKEVLFMGLFTETWLDRAPLFGDFSATYQTQLKEVARRVHASFLIQDMSTTHYALEFLFKASVGGGITAQQPDTMREYRILEDIYNLIHNEKTWLTMSLKAEIKKLAHPSFILKRIESRMRLGGLIASELRWSYPDLVIGIWQRWKHRFYCELRRGRRCNINLATLVEGMKGQVKLITGGGHPAAAAFTAEGDGFFEALDRVRYHISGHCVNSHGK